MTNDNCKTNLSNKPFSKWCRSKYTDEIPWNAFELWQSELLERLTLEQRKQFVAESMQAAYLSGGTVSLMLMEPPEGINE